MSIERGTPLSEALGEGPITAFGAAKPAFTMPIMQACGHDVTEGVGAGPTNTPSAPSFKPGMQNPTFG